MKTENLTAYEVVKEENLTDIHSKGTFLRHRKTGARVLLIENEDENKVFNIAFRTPPKDIRASDSENPDHCSLPQDNMFYPDMSLHSKRY